MSRLGRSDRPLTRPSSSDRPATNAMPSGVPKIPLHQFNGPRIAVAMVPRVLCFVRGSRRERFRLVLGSLRTSIEATSATTRHWMVCQRTVHNISQAKGKARKLS